MQVITPINKIFQSIRGVIWDVDGTMYATMDHAYNRQKFVYENIGDKSKKFEAYSDDWMDRYNDVYAKENLKGIWNNFAYADWDNNESKIWELYDKYNIENPVSTIKMDDVDIRDVIREVYSRGKPTSNRTSRLRLAINTTMGRGSLDKLIENSGIDDCFDTIITYDDILKLAVNGKVKQEYVKIENIDALRKLIPPQMKEYLEKPNSVSNLLTLNSMGVHPNEVVVLEDTVNGIYSCKNIMYGSRPLDAYVVGVTWGFVKDKDKLIEAGADAIMEHPKEIIPFLEMLGAFK